MHRDPLALLLTAALALPLLAACSDDPPRVGAPAPTSVGAPAAEPSAPPAPATTRPPQPASPRPAGPAPAPAPTPAETGAPADTPPFPADTRADTAEPAVGAQLSVVAVRTDRQDGYDRVVYELAGRGAPGWRVAWVDEPAEQASGDLVQVAGDVALSVSLSGVGVPDDVGVPSCGGPDRVDATGTRQVRQVWMGTVFEGLHDSFVGVVGAERPFRVFALTGPPRVVVDVRDR